MNCCYTRTSEATDAHADARGAGGTGRGRQGGEERAGASGGTASGCVLAFRCALRHCLAHNHVYRHAQISKGLFGPLVCVSVPSGGLLCYVMLCNAEIASTRSKRDLGSLGQPTNHLERPRSLISSNIHTTTLLYPRWT